jgi:hypothetical protein
MTDLAVCRVVWGGSPVVGGGVSTFYSVGTGAALSNALGTFYAAFKEITPLGTTMKVDSVGNVIDSNTGVITGAWSGGTGLGMNAATTGTYAAGVGARIKWQTAGITNGRHVAGSTYIVPILGAYYSADGTIADSLVSGTMQTAINNFLTTMGSSLVVWTRPRASTSGVEHSVTSGSLVDRVSWLRSRRQ